MAKDKRDCGCGPKPAYRPETASVGGSSGQTIAFRDGLPAIPDHMLSDSAPLPQHQTGRALGHIVAALEASVQRTGKPVQGQSNERLSNQPLIPIKRNRHGEPSLWLASLPASIEENSPPVNQLVLTSRKSRREAPPQRNQAHTSVTPQVVPGGAFGVGTPFSYSESLSPVGNPLAYMFSQAESEASPESGAEEGVIGGKIAKIDGGAESACPEWTVAFDLKVNRNAVNIPSNESLDAALDDLIERQRRLMSAGDSIQNHLPLWRLYEDPDAESFYLKVHGARLYPAPVCLIIFTVEMVGVESEVFFFLGNPVNWGKGSSGALPGTEEEPALIDQLRPRSTSCRETMRANLLTVDRNGLSDSEFFAYIDDKVEGQRPGAGLDENSDIVWEYDPANPGVAMVYIVTCEGRCDNAERCKPRSKKGMAGKHWYQVSWCGCHDDPSLEGLPPYPMSWLKPDSERDDVGELDADKRAFRTPRESRCTEKRVSAARAWSDGPSWVGDVEYTTPAVFRRATVLAGGWESDEAFVRRVRGLISNQPGPYDHPPKAFSPPAVKCPDGYTPVIFLHPDDPLHIYVDCVQCAGSCESDTDCTLLVKKALNMHIEYCGCP